MSFKCPGCGYDVDDDALFCSVCGTPLKKKLYKDYTLEDIEALKYSLFHYCRGLRNSIIFALLLAVIGIVLFTVSGIYNFNLILLLILGIIFINLGVVVAAVGIPVNITKYFNRVRIINNYKANHPEFKED